MTRTTTRAPRTRRDQRARRARPLHDQRRRARHLRPARARRRAPRRRTPPPARGRRYVIERELTSMAELEAIVADYLAAGGDLGRDPGRRPVLPARRARGAGSMTGGGDRDPDAREPLTEQDLAVAALVGRYVERRERGETPCAHDLLGRRRRVRRHRGRAAADRARLLRGDARERARRPLTRRPATRGWHALAGVRVAGGSARQRGAPQRRGAPTMPQHRNRRRLTDAERDARRQADRERIEQAARALLTSDGWQRWIRVRATNGLSRYSLSNQWLIAIECHARGITPTYVAGFRAFLALNRCVRKGQTAIKILAPVSTDGAERAVDRRHHLVPDRGGLAVPRRRAGRLQPPGGGLGDGRPPADGAGARGPRAGPGAPAARRPGWSIIRIGGANTRPWPSAGRARVRPGALDEPDGRLLRQRGRRELLRHAQAGAGADRRRGSTGRPRLPRPLRLRRGLLQPPPAPLHARDALARRLREPNSEQPPCEPRRVATRTLTHHDQTPKPNHVRRIGGTPVMELRAR